MIFHIFIMDMWSGDVVTEMLAQYINVFLLFRFNECVETIAKEITSFFAVQ